jgi:hypothetical protein
MTEVNAYDAAIEIEHILGGHDAHRRAHFWFAHGDRTMARDYLSLGSRHGVAAADEDLAVLERSGNTRIAACSTVVRPRPDGACVRPARSRRLRPALRSRRRMALLVVTVMGVLIATLLSQTMASARTLPDTYVPPTFADGTVVAGPSVDLAASRPPHSRRIPTVRQHTPRVAGTHTRTAPRPTSPAITAPTTTSSAATESATTTPAATSVPAAPVPTTSPEPDTAANQPALVSDPHISVSQYDGSGNTITAMFALDEKDGWRQLHFRPEAGMKFSAILWSTDKTPCVWRFTGLSGTEPDTTGTNPYEEVEVPAGERRDTTVSTHGWPVLSVAVRGGDRTAGCLLVNQQFQRTESTRAGQDSERPAADQTHSAERGAPAASEPAKESSSAPKPSTSSEPDATDKSEQPPTSASPSPRPTVEAAN